MTSTTYRITRLQLAMALAMARLRRAKQKPECQSMPFLAGSHAVSRPSQHHMANGHQGSIAWWLIHSAMCYSNSNAQFAILASVYRRANMLVQDIGRTTIDSDTAIESLQLAAHLLTLLECCLNDLQ